MNSQGAFAHKLPAPQFSCGGCGERFGTKSAKRTHKRECQATIEGFEPSDGRLMANVNRPEIIARAKAECAAIVPTLQQRIQSDLADPALIARANREWETL